MAFDEKLADRIRRTLSGQRGISEKQMFGGICFLSDDKMFVGVVKDELMARVGPEAADKVLTKTGVRRMDFTGKPMAGYVFVAPEALAGSALKSFVNLALNFTATVVKKPKRKKARALSAPAKQRAGGSAKPVFAKKKAVKKTAAKKKAAKKKSR